MSELNSLVTRYNLSRATLEKQCDGALFLNLIQEIPSFDDVVPYFGFTPPEIEELRVNHHKEQSRRHHMLYKWKNKNGSDATYLAIVNVFLQMRNRGLAEIVMKYVKEKIGDETQLPPINTTYSGSANITPRVYISPAVLRAHHAELCRQLNISEPTLISLTNELYAKNIIDIDVKIEVLRQGGARGAGILLTHIQMKVENPKHQPVIQEAMEKEEFLHEILEKMKKSKIK